MTAVERLLITSRDTDILKTLTRRVGALGASPDNKSIRKNLEENTRRAYNIRSDIVHGALSPKDSSIASKVGHVERVARYAIIHYGLALRENLNHPKADDNRIDQWLDRLIRRIDRHEGDSD